MEKSCRNCANFGLYYKKGDGKFYQTNIGTCSAKGCQVQKYKSCDFWRDGSANRKKRRERAIKVLERTLDELTIIRQILQEDKENDN